MQGLRVGICTQGLVERVEGGRAHIANGGVGVYIYQLVRQLLDHDDGNQYFLIRLGSGALDIYSHPRARAIFLRPGRPRPALALLGWQYASLANRLKLDLIHFTNQFGGVFMPRSIRRIASLHDTTPLLFPKMHPLRRVLIYRALAHSALSRSQRVIVASSAVAGDLLARRFVTPAQLVTIPDGVDSIFKPTFSLGFMERFKLSRPYILTVGVLEPRKNHLLLLQVLQRLLQSGRELDLVIIGREGWHWQNPLADQRWQGLKDHVHILSGVSDLELAEFYSRAALFAYPSFYEGFGLPPLEAMACGTPVVISTAGALLEVAAGAALAASPTDPEAFTAQALQLLDDHALRARMIAAGHQRARLLSWESTAAQTLAVYRQLAAAAPVNS